MTTIMETRLRPQHKTLLLNSISGQLERQIQNKLELQSTHNKFYTENSCNTNIIILCA